MASSERTTEAATEAAYASPLATQTNQDTGAVSRRAGQRGEEGLGHSSGAASAEGQALGLQCNLLMNARYHASREAFMDSVHRTLMFFIVVLGAAAITDLMPLPWLKGVFAAIAAILAAFDLTVDLSNRARTHALMKRRYFELLADLVRGKSVTEIEACMHQYSADEEPAFHALLAASWNAAQEMVYGNTADAYKIPAFHRLLKNVFRWGNARYRVVHGLRPALAQ